MSQSLAAAEKSVTALWDKHLESEFAHKSPEEALSTMTDNPRVTIVSTMVGGRGTEELRTFYAKYFLNQLPPDLEVTSVSRTVGTNRVVDELVIKFTHTVQMDWLMPGVPPTGKWIEFAMVVVVYMENGRIAAENLYWDTASIMKQAGLITDAKLPIAGPEHARNMIHHSEPLNELIHRAQR